MNVEVEMADVADAVVAMVVETVAEVVEVVETAVVEAKDVEETTCPVVLVSYPT